MSDNPTPKVVIIKNGPYRVSGAVPLSKQIIGVNAEGESETWQQGHVYPRAGGLLALPLRPLAEQALLRRHPQTNSIRRH